MNVADVHTDGGDNDGNVVVVGPGAIGTLFAFYMRLSGIPTVLADHNESRSSFISSNPVRIYSDKNSFEQASVRCVNNPADLGKAKIDYLLFSVKAYNTATAAKQWAPLVGPDTYVVSLQNGLGNLEILESFFGATKVISAVTSEASTFSSPGSVYHAAKGITKLAPLTESSRVAVERLALILRRAGFNSVVKKSAYDILWGKLVVNSAINPLSAMTNLTNGELLAHESTRKLLSEIATETYRVGRYACNVDPDIEDREDPSSSVIRAAATTARNKSSMLQDILRGKRTEIDFINGAIYSVAKSNHGLAAPLNGTLYGVIKSIEEKNMLRLPYSK